MILWSLASQCPASHLSICCVTQLGFIRLLAPQLFFKQFLARIIFLVYVGLGLYGDQTSPSKEKSVGSPPGLLPVPCLLTNFDRFSIGGCRRESILKRGKGNFHSLPTLGRAALCKIRKGRRQQIKSNIGRRGNFHWKQLVANQSWRWKAFSKRGKFKQWTLCK